MIRMLFRPEDGPFRNDMTVEMLPPILAAGTGLLWLDIMDEPLPYCEKLFREMFNFHPLAIDDALNEAHVPKVDNWDTYLYIVLHGINYTQPDHDPLSLPEIDIFLGKNYLITYRQSELNALEYTWSLCQEDERFFKRGADHLFYRLADAFVDDHISAVAQIEAEMEEIEDEIFGEMADDTLEQIFIHKRRVLQLRRTIAPQREVFTKLSRNHYAVIQESEQIFFHDIYDHMVRLYDLMDSLRDLTNGSLDTYLSIVNNRMNSIMKTLTIMTALFLPITAITGFFGMNFLATTSRESVLTGLLPFELTLLVMLLIPVSMLIFMHRRGWL